MPATYADLLALKEWLGSTPANDAYFGVRLFAEWYRRNYAA